MSMMQEFKKFAVRGNVVDMAVGIIIGAAFGRIVTSLVNDVIMPPIGLLVGGIDFANLMVILKEATESTAVVSINYGTFINTLINFLIVAFAIFMVVKGMNSLKRKQEEEPAAAPPPPKQEILLTEIRDILKSQSS